MQQFAVTFCLTLLSFVTWAQSFMVYNYSVPEGLPSSEVYDVFKDSKGFLWFASDNGVVKFNGNKMEVLSTRAGLTDPVVFASYEDDKGRIWFRSYSGSLNYYENGTIKKFANLDPQYGLITSISAEPEKEQLWISGFNFLGRINQQGSFLLDPPVKESLVCKTIGKTDLLAPYAPSTHIKQIVITGQAFKVTVSDTIIESGVYRSARWKDKLYVTIGKDIFEYDGNVVSKVLTGPSPVIALSTDRQERLWVGYKNYGVERYDSDTFKNPWRFDLLSKKSVTKIEQDNESGFWFTTLENGVYYIPDFSIENFSLSLTSKIKTVAASSDHVIIGDHSGILYLFDSKTKKLIKKKSLNSPIRSAAIDKEGRIWICTDNATQVLTANFDNYKIFEEINSAVFSDVNENYIWAHDGLMLKKYAANGDFLDSASLKTILRDILVDDTLVYLASRMGLQLFNHKLDLINIPEKLSHFKISYIAGLNDSTLLVTTSGSGFLLVDKSTFKFRQFDSKNRFLADNVYTAIKNDSLLWLATEKGLAVVSLQSLVNGRPRFNYLTQGKGLISNRINFLSFGDKSIWAFSDNGFSVIPYTRSDFSTTQPLFYLKKILVNNGPIGVSDLSQLTHNQHNLTIDYGYISYNHQPTFIRYRLSKDSPWIYSGGQKLQFSSLAPGHYQFEMEYTVDNNQWSMALAPINFVIQPRWWNLWYMQVVGLMSLLVVGFWYIRHQQSVYSQKNHYLKIINEHQQKLIQSGIITLERERNRIAKELHDRVGTNLSAVKLMLGQLLRGHKEPLATDVEEQFQIAIKEIKDIIYALIPPGLERYGLFAGLKNYVVELNKNIPLNILLKTFGNESHNYELNIVIFRVLQELLTNSIKHSFAKNITIHISAFEDVLNIVYEDDGVAFSYDPAQSEITLDSIESRIQSVNGTLTFESGKFGISYTIDIPVQLK